MERLSHKTYNELFSLWLGIVFVFGIMYFILTVFAPEHGVTIRADWHIIYKLLDSLYFSVTTATTTGYGDLAPLGFSKALSAVEVVLAFGTFTIFLGKLIAEDGKLLETSRRPVKAAVRKPAKRKKRRS